MFLQMTYIFQKQKKIIFRNYRCTVWAMASKGEFTEHNQLVVSGTDLEFISLKIKFTYLMSEWQFQLIRGIFLTMAFVHRSLKLNTSKPSLCQQVIGTKQTGTNTVQHHFLSILVVAACKSGATSLRDIVALNIVDWLVAWLCPSISLKQDSRSM